MDIRVVDSDTLIRLNQVAYDGDLNRAINPSWLDHNIDPDGIHVITKMMLHNDAEFRCQVLVKIKGQTDPETVWLDIPVELYQSLPSELSKLVAS